MIKFLKVSREPENIKTKDGDYELPIERLIVGVSYKEGMRDLDVEIGFPYDEVKGMGEEEFILYALEEVSSIVKG